MSLTDQLERLAQVEPAPYPVVSLYLNTQPNQHGRDNYQTFVRKELKNRAATYAPKTPERESLDRDAERIARFLETGVQPSSNGVAIFACDAGQLFETLQVDAPVDEHSLYLGDRPHLYPLARLVSQYPRYAALLADTHSARILVIADGAVASEVALEGQKTRRTSQGGWSQARYQRHIENFHLQHVKEVVDALGRIVAAEGIEQVVVAGDAVVLPLLREQMPKPLQEKIADEMTLATDAPASDVVRSTLDAMRAVNERTDREKVDAAIGAYRAGGLGVVGPDETLLALTNGQVDELLLTASLSRLEPLHGTEAARMAMANDAGLAEPAVETAAAGEAGGTDVQTVRLADELVNKATQTSARITFIEDPALLESYGGVAALLRYRVGVGDGR
jgi:peptide chain release factor subunit 1